MARPIARDRRIAARSAAWLVVLALALRLLAPVLHHPTCEHHATFGIGSAGTGPACGCCDQPTDPTPTQRADHRHAGFCAICELRLSSPGAPLTVTVTAPPIGGARGYVADLEASVSVTRNRWIHRPRGPPSSVAIAVFDLTNAAAD